MSDSKINVLVVDDSAVARLLLVHLLESDARIQVIGTVNDGQAAVDFVLKNQPDAVLMDIHMPRLDGFEATRRIMETQPVPIIICSATTDPKEVATTFRLMEAGAVACVEKPVTREHVDFEQLATNLLQTVKLMSEVKVVRRWPRSRTARPSGPGAHPEWKLAATAPRLLGMGASTGGPLALQSILANLPKDFPIPILIVQHIARGFLPGLVEWLNQTTGLSVQAGSHGISPLPGHVYLAPDDLHMGIAPNGRIILTREDSENGLRPAVAYLFRSLAEVCGPNAVGVLLTGMGRDGAAELKLMKDRGATTIAQDRESSVVHGMPAEAIELGGVTRVLPADKIADFLIALAAPKPIARGIEL
ncbi:MAG: chemotaxis-specific protein-glutamate methyltransferase CheB [Verrucomicrobiales bacterium]|nr:chemotaxis-specific protein-glutamate methyltransferase CheB [Verrucomicrobiales bacterium]